MVVEPEKQSSNPDLEYRFRLFLPYLSCIKFLIKEVKKQNTKIKMLYEVFW